MLYNMASQMAANGVAFILLHCILISSNIKSVSAYYCEWDLCANDQYCCGDHLCCEYVYSLWYFWVAILFVVIVLSACGGLFRYCYYHSSQFVDHRVINYVPVPNVRCVDDHNHYTSIGVDPSCQPYSQKPPSYVPSRDPPPPYSAVMSSQHQHGGYDGPPRYP